MSDVIGKKYHLKAVTLICLILALNLSALLLIGRYRYALAVIFILWAILLSFFTLYHAYRSPESVKRAAVLLYSLTPLVNILINLYLLILIIVFSVH
jgi:hypothetical protein